MVSVTPSNTHLRCLSVAHQCKSAMPIMLGFLSLLYVYRDAEGMFLDGIAGRFQRLSPFHPDTGQANLREAVKLFFLPFYFIFERKATQQKSE